MTIRVGVVDTERDETGDDDGETIALEGPTDTFCKLDTGVEHARD